MNKKVYNIGNLLILCMLLVFSACSDEVIPPGPGPVTPGDGTKEIPIALDIDGLFDSSDPSTYGTNYPGVDVPGSSLENAVNDVVVYIFDNLYLCEKIIDKSAPVPSPIGPVMVKTGIKHIVVVVNGDGKLTLEKTNPANVGYADLLQRLTDKTTTLPKSPFLMTGIKNNVPLPDQVPENSPYSVSVDVARACAKVTMRITKSANAQFHDIKLKRITLVHGASRVPLYNAPFSNPTEYDITSFTTNFPTPFNEVPNYPNYVAVLDSFYTYESLCGSDTTKAVRFEILTEVNSPANERTARFYLATYEQSPGDSVFNVKRNHWYDINVNIADPGMDSVYVTVNVNRWNMADTIKKIEGEGGEFKTAAPFKLVKNYTTDDITMKSQIAAIDKHTKGASWIDMKITDGTVWSLKLKDDQASRNQGVIASVDHGNTWAPLPISSTGGDTVQRVYIYRPYVENNEPKQGPVLYVELGGQHKQDFVIQPRDTTPIPTNSYILRPQLTPAPVNETRVYIPLAGVYRYWEDYILQNGDSIPAGDVSAVLLWSDNPTNAVVKNISVINKGKRDLAYIYAEAGVPGNAVIAMTVGSSIYWSFHVWVTEYNPYEAAGQKLHRPTKNVFMDRDLGAMNNTYDAEGKVRGLLYQFGRKDPFPGGSSNWGSTFTWYNSSGSLMALSSASVPPALSPLTDVRPLKAIPASINYPTTFYTRSGATDWTLSTENRFLWSTQGGNKTAFDPCPEGWRVPEQESLGALNSPWYDVTFDPLYTNGRYYASVGYYPYSGYIGTSTSAITGAATTAYYWTSWPGASPQYQGTGLLISTASVNTAPMIDKAYGASVRCVVDLNYLLNAEGGGLFGSGGGVLEEELLP